MFRLLRRRAVGVEDGAVRVLGTVCRVCYIAGTGEVEGICARYLKWLESHFQRLEPVRNMANIDRRAGSRREDGVV